MSVLLMARRSPEVRTIIILTDGRYVTVGWGDDQELAPEIRARMATLGLSGWLAIMRGNPYAEDALELFRVHAIGQSRDHQWDGAVNKLHLDREQARR